MSEKSLTPQKCLAFTLIIRQTGDDHHRRTCLVYSFTCIKGCLIQDWSNRQPPGVRVLLRMWKTELSGAPGSSKRLRPATVR